MSQIRAATPILNAVKASVHSAAAASGSRLAYLPAHEPVAQSAINSQQGSAQHRLATLSRAQQQSPFSATNATGKRSLPPLQQSHPASVLPPTLSRPSTPAHSQTNSAFPTLGAKPSLNLPHLSAIDQNRTISAYQARQAADQAKRFAKSGAASASASASHTGASPFSHAHASPATQLFPPTSMKSTSSLFTIPGGVLPALRSAHQASDSVQRRSQPHNIGTAPTMSKTGQSFNSTPSAQVLSEQQSSGGATSRPVLPPPFGNSFAAHLSPQQSFALQYVSAQPPAAAASTTDSSSYTNATTTMTPLLASYGRNATLKSDFNASTKKLQSLRMQTEIAQSGAGFGASMHRPRNAPAPTTISAKHLNPMRKRTSHRDGPPVASWNQSTTMTGNNNINNSTARSASSPHSGTTKQTAELARIFKAKRELQIQQKREKAIQLQFECDVRETERRQQAALVQQCKHEQQQLQKQRAAEHQAQLQQAFTMQRQELVDKRQQFSAKHPNKTELEIAQLLAKEVQQRNSARRKVKIQRRQTVSRLANQMDESTDALISRLRALGLRKSAHDWIDLETAELLCIEMDCEPLVPKYLQVDSVKQVKRGPVVCILGHVDSGKTTLLDVLRSENRAAREAGGITQAIGAFSVKLQSNENENKQQSDDAEKSEQQQQQQNALTDEVTDACFLDTPGHAAFRAMRARGANKACTDLIVLVVSAVEGVQPQTAEVIEMALANSIPIVVALNKVDLDDADPERVKQELAQYNVVVESQGGEVLCCEISAKHQLGIDDLKESIMLTADLLELRAPVEGYANAFVLEARTDPALGIVLNLVVRSGRLSVGDLVMCGLQYTRVRSLIDETGKRLQSVGPSQPCQLTGFTQLNQLDDQLCSLVDEEHARELLAEREAQLVKNTTPTIDDEDDDSVDDKAATDSSSKPADDGVEPMSVIDEITSRRESTVERQVLRTLSGGRVRRRKARVVPTKLTTEEVDAMSAEAQRTVQVIIKCDVRGSMEAMQEYIRLLPTAEVRLQVLRISLGQINEDDVRTATHENVPIIGFNVDCTQALRQLADKYKVIVKSHPIIYHVFDEIRDLLSDKLPPKISSQVTGTADVVQIIKLHGKKRKEVQYAAGCEVEEGCIRTTEMARVLRHDKPIWTGKIASIRNHKAVIEQITAGSECGIMLDGFNQFHIGDKIEGFAETKTRRVLNDAEARGFETVAKANRRRKIQQEAEHQSTTSSYGA